MDKITYLTQLAEGLARWVPERERQDILRYYAEYFEEAGVEREAEVIQELGDPWALSSRLAVEGGYVSQEGANSWTPRRQRKKIWPWVLVGTAAVLLFIVGAVITAAMSFGNLVGRMVSNAIVSGDAVEEVTVIAEAEDKVGFVAVPSSAPNVAYFIEDDTDVGIWTMEDGTLEMFDEIDLDVSIANVMVDVGEDYSLYISSASTLGGYSLKWEVKNGVLKIRDSGSTGQVQISSWNEFKNTFGINADAMDVVITVPEGAVMDELKIKTGMGDVFLAHLEMANKLEAETGLGDVECYEIRSWDEVELETGMGDVKLGVQEAYSGVEYDLKTGMGDVEANLNSVEQDWDYEAKTGMGTVSVNGESRGSGKVERKSTGGYKLEAESGMGDVKLFFQDDRW